MLQATLTTDTKLKSTRMQMRILPRQQERPRTIATISLRIMRRMLPLTLLILLMSMIITTVKPTLTHNAQGHPPLIQLHRPSNLAPRQLYPTRITRRYLLLNPDRLASATKHLNHTNTTRSGTRYYSDSNRNLRRARRCPPMLRLSSLIAAQLAKATISCRSAASRSPFAARILFSTALTVVRTTVG